MKECDCWVPESPARSRSSREVRVEVHLSCEVSSGVAGGVAALSETSGVSAVGSRVQSARGSQSITQLQILNLKFSSSFRPSSTSTSRSPIGPDRVKTEKRTSVLTFVCVAKAGPSCLPVPEAPARLSEKAPPSDSF